MKEPESHTLRLLREFRREFAEHRREMADLREEMTAFRAKTDASFDELLRVFTGESIVARYAVSGVDTRITRLEKRVSTLDELEKRVADLEAQ
jgi:hypothetical protein